MHAAHAARGPHTRGTRATGSGMMRMETMTCISHERGLAGHEQERVTGGRDYERSPRSRAEHAGHAAGKYMHAGEGMHAAGREGRECVGVLGGGRGAYDLQHY
jgi:hypothetical protein